MSPNIRRDIDIVGIINSRISSETFGDDANLTIKTVGIIFKIPSKYWIFIKRGIKRRNVANIKANVIAEFASLVLSTSMEINIPIPINPKPMKRRIKTKISELNMGTPNKSSKIVHAIL